MPVDRITVHVAIIITLLFTELYSGDVVKKAGDKTQVSRSEIQLTFQVAVTEDYLPSVDLDNDIGQVLINQNRVKPSLSSPVSFIRVIQIKAYLIREDLF